jgi:pimeloyl-ACP methyl ester carboxylesterase
MEILKKYQVRGATGAVRRVSINGRIVDFWSPAEPTPYLIVTHDGQNIFDKRTSTRHRTWELAGTATKVAIEFGTPPPTIIAVFHSGSPRDPYGRGKDLAPQDVFTDGVEPVVNHSGIWPTPTPTYPLSELRGNQYLDEIVNTIMPKICDFVDHQIVPAQTALLGASMGGLAALNGMAKNPDLFRTALAFSPHWTTGLNPLVDGLMRSLPPAGKHKLWMSHGTKGLDANYAPFQERANNIAISLGYKYSKDLATPIFNRTNHNELSWSSYVNQALRFWLKSSR